MYEPARVAPGSFPVDREVQLRNSGEVDVIRSGSSGSGP